VPGATLVTGTATLEVFGATVTDGGAVATPGLLELRLNVKPPDGAGDDSVSERF
jgi:hypothetical protein